MRVIKAPFSTADADYPQFSFLDGDLVLSFKDWQEQLVKVKFNETAGFCWRSIESSFECATDNIYEQEIVTFCPEYIEASRQWRLCFNSSNMCLDIQFSSITMIATQKGNVANNCDTTNF